MRVCLQCGAPLTKRAHESKKRFAKKRFCSSACSRVYMKDHKLGWWSPENKDFDYLPGDYEGFESI